MVSADPATPDVFGKGLGTHGNSSTAEVVWWNLAVRVLVREVGGRRLTDLLQAALRSD